RLSFSVPLGPNWLPERKSNPSRRAAPTPFPAQQESPTEIHTFCNRVFKPDLVLIPLDDRSLFHGSFVANKNVVADFYIWHRISLLGCSLLLQKFRCFTH